MLDIIYISSAVIIDRYRAFNSQMNPYLSVRGGWSLLNLLAVESLVVPVLVDWKKEPMFCRESKTVGGLFSSATTASISTEGNSGSSGVEADTFPLSTGGDIAVVGNARDEDALLSSEGRGLSSVVEVARADLPRSVALDTEENKLRPTARA